MRRLLVIAPVVLAAVTGSASADGPGAGGASTSLFAPNGQMYTTAFKSGHTVVSMWHGRDKARRVVLAGSLGFPVPTSNATRAALSHDGGTLLLAGFGKSSRFVALDAHSLRVRRSVSLQGRFNFDALSPDGRTLFLIQYVSRPPNHYYVRAYDLSRGRLFPQIIFDAKEKAEGPMSGQPLTRATGPTGRWVYTLYIRPGSGRPFVHALDTVDRHAVCIDLPQRLSPAKAWRLNLTLKNRKLLVGATWATRPIAVIDTKTLRVRA
jgi:hypothetical protein